MPERRFKVTRAQILARGLTNRCPNCGGHTLFKPGTLFEINSECPSCGLTIGRGASEGFYLGSLSLNYGVTVVCFLVPIALLGFLHVIGARTAIAVALAGAIVVPALLYRPSRSWWLMNYYLFLPQHLPANGGSPDARSDSNT